MVQSRQKLQSAGAKNWIALAGTAGILVVNLMVQCTQIPADLQLDDLDSERI
jgi:hypothetical protein